MSYWVAPVLVSVSVPDPRAWPPGSSMFVISGAVARSVRFWIVNEPKVPPPLPRAAARQNELVAIAVLFEPADSPGAFGIAKLMAIPLGGAARGPSSRRSSQVGSVPGPGATGFVYVH